LGTKHRKKDGEVKRGTKKRVFLGGFSKPSYRMVVLIKSNRRGRKALERKNAAEKGFSRKDEGG